MIELHLIGYTADLGHLVLDLEGTGGGRYRLIVDGDLYATLDDLREQRWEEGLDVGLWEPVEWVELDEEDDVVTIDAADDVVGVAAAADESPGRDDPEPVGDQQDDLLTDVVEDADRERVRAEERAREQAQAEAEERAQAEADERARVEAEERAQAEADERARVEAEERARAEELERAEERARVLERERHPRVRVLSAEEREEPSSPPAAPATNGHRPPAPDDELDALITRVREVDAASDDAEEPAEPQATGTEAPSTAPPPPRRSAERVGPSASATSRPAGSAPPAPERPRTAGGVPVPEEARLSPNEIQGLLRSGKSVRQVAKAAGTDERWVRRWLEPIEAERQRVVEEARELAATVDGDTCAVPLAAAVDHHLARLRAERVTWTATRRDDRPWRITVRYVHDGRARTASWTVDRSAREVKPASPAARELGWLESSASRR